MAKPSASLESPCFLRLRLLGYCQNGEGGMYMGDRASLKACRMLSEFQGVSASFKCSFPPMIGVTP